ncbi:olfactory receptor 1019 [Xenopus laevis]|uniref:Olfactory receptor n=2 Tax=Xenopus laevis TaxID=8355 RepID=A0A974H9C6_XENLA|nr:olfactory receptor 1019 [Xenopus laevis]OCT69121.1 hypothetical protein XELAEV_18040430mg [Xenopus laevis]
MDINVTIGNRFILLGLTNSSYQQAVCVLMFLTVYLITWLANSLLIIVVSINTHLRTPMYFFLINLSIIDISMSSSTLPKILQITFAQDKSVSLLECATQMFIILVLGVTECTILAVMAYDRYAAICKPLHYNTIMNKGLCIGLAAKCWIVGFINAVFQVFLTFQLPFCRSHHINHYFCEVPPFFRLSCQDTFFNVIAMYVAACVIVISSFFLILVSYVYIISTILKIRSSEGRLKAFSTCASHLSTVSLYYCTIMSMYLRPRSAYSPETDKTVSIIYTSVTPMLNPIIYSIRNKDIKLTIRKYLTSKQKYFFQSSIHQ